jgi:uncharacterized RDD family membrane protein YckC
MNTPNAYAPPKANVADVSPDGEITLASRLARLGAAILDSIIIGALVYAPLIATGSLGAAFADVTRTGNSLAFWGVFMSGAGLVSLLLIVGWAIITFRLVAANGQTIAKKLFGIKVLRTDGARCGLARIVFMRWLPVALLEMIPLVAYVVYLLDALMIFGREQRCLHDYIADTIVVKA